MDFSSNAHTPHLSTEAFSTDKPKEFEVPSRHPDLCFGDGSIAILCGHQYFLVHESLLSLHSTVLKEMIEASCNDETCQLTEGRPTLRLSHRPEDMFIFLKAVYGYVMHNIRILG
jgi:hypothetical protein